MCVCVLMDDCPTAIDSNHKILDFFAPENSFDKRIKVVETK